MRKTYKESRAGIGGRKPLNNKIDENHYCCSRCKEIKHKSEFHKVLLKYNKRGLESQCKLCKEKYIDKKKRSDNGKRYHRADPRKQMFAMAKFRAKKQNVPFSIKLEDITIPEKCPVFNTELKVNDGFRSNNSPSLDKVIPKLGYTLENINVISYRANTVKLDGTLEELTLIANYMEANGKV